MSLLRLPGVFRRKQMNNEGIEKRKPEEKCVTVKKGIKKQSNFYYNFFYQAPPQNGLFCYISTNIR